MRNTNQFFQSLIIVITLFTVAGCGCNVKASTSNKPKLEIQSNASNQTFEEINKKSKELIKDKAFNIVFNIEAGLGNEQTLIYGINTIKNYLNNKGDVIAEINGISPLRLIISVKWDEKAYAISGMFTIENKLADYYLELGKQGDTEQYKKSCEKIAEEIYLKAKGF